MLDVAVAQRRFSFLGPEFLTWLWFVTENDPELIETVADAPVQLVVGNRIVLEKAHREEVERIMIRGETAQMDEGIMALRKGALVSEVHLAMDLGQESWRFNIKGETLDIGSLKVPSTGPVRMGQEIEGAVLEKGALVEKPVRLMDDLFKEFLKRRLSKEWREVHLKAFQKWLAESA